MTPSGASSEVTLGIPMLRSRSSKCIHTALSMMTSNCCRRDRTTSSSGSTSSSEQRRQATNTSLNMAFLCHYPLSVLSLLRVCEKNSALRIAVATSK